MTWVTEYFLWCSTNDNVKATYKVVCIDAQSEKHVEEFYFDKTRVFEFLLSRHNK